ncbi:hypothetical protein ACWGJT_31025 [Streptomyces xantholiticus]
MDQAWAAVVAGAVALMGAVVGGFFTVRGAGRGARPAQGPAEHGLSA